MKRIIIVFAKEPGKGNVKTRLNGCFSERDRTRLYKAFIQDTLATTRKIKNVRKILAFTSKKKPRYLKSIADDFEMIEQKGRTLGDRMYNALCLTNEVRSEKTVIIGTDTPTLPARLIVRAFMALNRKDIVIGPSADGGYYLIGMKKPYRKIFQGVRWSSPSVLKKTLANAESEGITTALLDEWYDVDDRMGLEMIKKDLAMLKDKNIAINTRRFFKGGK